MARLSDRQDKQELKTMAKLSDLQNKNRAKLSTYVRIVEFFMLSWLVYKTLN